MPHRPLVLAMFLTVLLATAVWSAPQSLYFKAADGKWLPLPATSHGGAVTFTLDPAQIKSGSTMVVLGLPAGIRLDDERPPVMTGLKLDGRALKDAPVIDLDWLAEQPRTLVIGIADGENPLDPASFTVRVNGTVLSPAQAKLCFTDKSGRNARVELQLGELLAQQGKFTNRLDWRIADQSPQRNFTSRALAYRCLGEVTGDPMLVPESSYPGYEKLEVLTDGKVMTPGETTYGSTWASEEVPGDHWIVMAWPQAREVGGVEVFWATFQGVFHAPQELRVQTWDGQKWATVTTLRNLDPTRSTTISFPPVQTTRLRLFQPDGKGNPVRPNIMWITEIKVL